MIGIGGSYLGARAAIEFLKSPFYNNLKKDTPDIYYVGNNINPTYLNEVISICEGRDFSVNVISKSGTTTEPALAFRVFKQLVEKKYGKDGAKDHIFATTDKAKGTLKSLSDTEGYETFVVPDDVGGRYSVLTAVGLLPIAVAGCDIEPDGWCRRSTEGTHRRFRQQRLLQVCCIAEHSVPQGQERGNAGFL